MTLSEPRETARGALRPTAGRPTRGAVLRDVLLGAVTAAQCAVELLLRLAGGGLSSAEAAVTMAAAVPVTALVVVLTRLYPLLAVVVSLLSSFWVYSFSVLLVCASYLAGRRMPGVRSALVSFAVGAAPCAVAIPLLWPEDRVAWVTVAVTAALNIALPWMVGVHRRQHLALAAAGWEHARQLQREHALTADRARLRERSRIAQDMHDSLGHELSLIALRAGALEIAPDLDGEHRRSAADLRSTAVTATQHLREVIGVLRTDAGPPPTVPADEGVPALVERVRDSGMRITLVRENGIGDLPPMVDRAVHRVVQESLTNAAKYAPGAEVRVWITADGTRLEVRVVNSAPPDGRRVSATGGRHGLIGLRERVRVVGGAFAAGPVGDGGWEVCATMPLDGSPGAGAEEPDGEGTEIDQLQSAARRRVRRWSLALVLPPVAAVVGAVLALAWAALDVVEQGDRAQEAFDSLRAGDGRDHVERLLLPVPAGPDAPPAEAGGVSCSYHRGADDILPGGTASFRLCFAEGRLVTKEEVPVR
ncbi:histidine kinase [Nocardiopsis sp. CT-R113]|uniref:histidine kinase n=1 Tax=Nocardiopsis codii TaxID=3065942 RepID=A0ABU7KF09_9ACTN|nr:histidine kinase [Nocardiopsis sp. CT-R113]MEE2040597.1 histidine kinase [Nocardiopsis sp. CT-R113]